MRHRASCTLTSALSGATLRASAGALGQPRGPGHLFPDDTAKHRLGKWAIIRVGQIGPQSVIHHGLISATGLLSPGSKLVQHRIVDVDGDASLPLRRQKRSSLRLREIIFRSHMSDFQRESRDERKSAGSRRCATCRQQRVDGKVHLAATVCMLCIRVPGSDFIER